jgi:hypothetical protein
VTRRAVIIVCDSLRRDLITPADAPTLAEAACNFTAARSVFPSTTPRQFGLDGRPLPQDPGR